ncbi:hypothetical protein EPIR_3132 [Erwinia piriflorinigrans CFBP 5888]|uniref:Uncharacterized protein n=1 Tax=Erwinia piriflorinigrans CFBP 5888 TaxID=1161919 RepID=V5ZB82_9GAMM|nr:hypothetical protein EPIR_3132 [Erwinia piriflorinigrans CFBP 5888]
MLSIPVNLLSLSIPLFIPTASSHNALTKVSSDFYLVIIVIMYFPSFFNCVALGD